MAEVIQGGLVLETNISEIVKQGEYSFEESEAMCSYLTADRDVCIASLPASTAQATAKARKASAAGPRPPGLIGGNGPTGTGFDVGLNAASAAADTLGGWARDWLGRR